MASTLEDDDDQLHKATSSSSTSSNATANSETLPSRIILKDVTYDIKKNGKKVRLIHGVSATFSGEFVAVMGSSGNVATTTTTTTTSESD
jgi:primase-polymerase (primpol)-like protein